MRVDLQARRGPLRHKARYSGQGLSPRGSCIGGVVPMWYCGRQRSFNREGPAGNPLVTAGHRVTSSEGKCSSHVVASTRRPSQLTRSQGYGLDAPELRAKRPFPCCAQLRPS